MRQRSIKTAERFGVLDRMSALERALLKLDRVSEVEFSLDGFYDGIMQVIICPKYDIPATLPNYFEVRRTVLQNILEVARSFGLRPSGDIIEDYGEHWYIVRDCDKTWELNKEDTNVQM